MSTSGTLAPATPAFSPATDSLAAASGRFVRIDVLRAVAAIAVIAYHVFGAKVGWHLPWTQSGLADLSGHDAKAAAQLVVSLGWSGVPLFFALSGFCIHGAFLRQQRFDAGVFFWRRFWRIYPPFLAALGVFCFWPIWRLGRAASGGDVLDHLATTFVLSPERFWSPFNPSFWSVAVEFQCYLLYPLFLFIRSRLGIARAALGWFGLALAGKILAGAFGGWPDHAIAFWSCASFFSFGDWALGALVAEDLATRTERTFYRPWFLFAAATALVLSSFSRVSIGLSFSAAAVVGALLIKNYACQPAPITRLEGALARLGVISYSLYLWHQPLLGPLEKLGRELCAPLPLNLARAGTLLVTALGLMIVAVVSYHLLERPGIALASRFRRNPRPQ